MTDTFFWIINGVCELCLTERCDLDCCPCECHEPDDDEDDDEAVETTPS